MKNLILLLSCLVGLSASAQFLQRNPFTTNANGSFIIGTNLFRSSALSNRFDGVAHFDVPFNVPSLDATKLTGQASLGSLATNIATSGDVLTATSATTAKFVVPNSGGSNASPISLTYSGTNIAVSCATPSGTIVGGPLTF